MGYDLFVSSVALADTMAGDTFRVDIKMQNRGVAPFYYDWTVRLAVLDALNSIDTVFDTDWKLTSVVDNNADVLMSFVKPGPGLAQGAYTLLMQAHNPMQGGTPLCFANTGWGASVPGWLTLGQFRVTQGTAARRSAPRRMPDRPTIGPLGRGILVQCESAVSGSIVDPLGRPVAVFNHESRFSWPGPVETEKGVKGGVYFVRISGIDGVVTRRFVLR